MQVDTSGTREPLPFLLGLVLVVVVVFLLTVLSVPPLVRARACSNVGNAGAAMKSLPTQEGIWRSQDVDKNGIADYWTRDVAGFHAVWDGAGNPVKLIDLSFARADRAPARQYQAPSIPLGGAPEPKQGYFYQAMVTDRDCMPYVDPALPPPTAENCPEGPCTNRHRFGFSAFPSRYNVDGNLSFMVDESGIVWQSDLGCALEVLHRRTLSPEPGWTVFGTPRKAKEESLGGKILAALAVAGLLVLTFWCTGSSRRLPPSVS